jgi:DNA invertase Pin-like site-specific DNA recombinase
MPESTPRQAVLHPYARISDPDQRKGGGLQRQGPEARPQIEEFARLFGFAVGKRVYVDDGVSAFHGINATPKHELGRFLADAKRGVIRPGDCLLIELWDRLSRQDIWASIGLVNDLRQLGVHLGRLDRMKLLRADSTDPGDFFEAAVELMRGHSESAAKSLRNGAAWKRKRAAARATGALVTRRLPAWLEEHGGGVRVRPAAALALARIFALAAAGYGVQATVKRLTAERVPPWGERVIRAGRRRSQFAGRWTRSYVAKLLGDRRLLGEYQPQKSDGSPDGPPIAGYYPRAVTDEQWFAARRGAAGRRIQPGPTSKFVNLFTGLLRSATDGGVYHASLNVRAGRNWRARVLRNAESRQRDTPCRSFPLETFERGILSLLAEIDPHEILNGDQGPDETTALATELGRVEEELAAAKAFMAGRGFSPAIGERITDLEDRQRDLAADLAEARQRAAHPLSESWGECQSLVKALDSAADPQDARLRLRGALRRIVESVWLVVIPRGIERLCAAQIHFAGGKRREYLIYHRPARGNAAARAERHGWVGALAKVAPAAGALDFGKLTKSQRTALEALLSGLDLGGLLE